MKLDTKAMRYLTAEDWRVLTAVEMGSKNHELVPTPLIAQISGLRGGTGVHKCISNLAKVGLIAKVKNAKYDGYRLTYGGLDYLALNTHRKQKSVYSVGNQIGVGKESDIYVVADESGTQRVLKIHRLGRISFRTVKANRDYLRNRSSGSWMYMSRLAAMKEFAFMSVLRDNGFPVPKPIAQSRHTIVMSLIDAFPLRQISSIPEPALLYSELIDMILRLARHGLIHGDFNEFNILVEEEPSSTGAATSTSKNVSDEPSILPVDTQFADASSNISPSSVTLVPTLIDFPQMLSIDHANAEFYFDRDVSCIKRFFERRFHFSSDEPGPFFSDVKKTMGKDSKRLDIEVEATGFSKKMAKELEVYMREVGVDGDTETEDAPEGDRDDNEPPSADEAEIEDIVDEQLQQADVAGEATEPAIVDTMENLSLQVESTSTDAGEAPLPLDLVSNPHDVFQKIHSKKRASGWAI
ncbi:hypothetical protein B0A49_01705 [Cryomyces minteri]|uniref:Serine/threonine-protein kinase RIO2 n=1 Tax=Cryomyces minteri TaxID=331657 RepID=A0A4U0XUB8_9PEZI|nr:hypothetical protein B0A49_01705 [Cryomyces minteri]